MLPLDKISKIGFGSASIAGEGAGYGFGDISEVDAVKLVREAFDRGINLFDTAPIYGFGTSEKRLGLALKGIRDRVLIASKSGITWHDNMRVNLSNEALITQKMLEQSLRDLQTDYIDIYFIHYPDPRVDIRYPMEVLAKARSEGKIRAIGLCNTTQEDFKSAVEIDKVEVLQAEHNAFNQKFYQEFEEKLKETFFMGWGSFDKGILTGRVKEGRRYDKTDARSWAPWWKKQNLKEKLEKVMLLEKFLKEKEISLLEFAIQFNFMFPFLNSALCGVRNLEQLDSLLYAMEKKIDNSILEEGAKFLC